MPQNLIKDLMTRSEKTLDFLRGTLQGIRTGRAHPALVEDIRVDYFGTATPIKNMGTVTIPEARQIMINPWDKTAMKAIEKAIQASPLGINPQNDGETIRLNLPELTQARRIELTKIVNKSAEEARISIRNVRRDVIDSLKKMEKESEITEDDLKKYQKEAQEQTDAFIKKVDVILADKEKEIMEKQLHENRVSSGRHCLCSASLCYIIQMMTEKEFLKRIKEIGGSVYVAGGWVRDRLMGRCPHDRDYVLCGLDEGTFAEAFPQAVKAGSSFPVFILRIDGEPCDVAMSRTEKKKGTGYKGFVVEYGPDVTIEEDLFRRDTTVNSMAWSPEKDKLIDPFGGQADIKAKIIRATSYHFCEDPVRALRAARQAAEFDFMIEKNTLEMMGRCGHELCKEPKERIFGELERAMLCSRPSIFFSMLAEAGVLGAVIPTLEEMWKRQSEESGKDFSRVMGMLDKTAELSERPEVRFASLVRSIRLSLEDSEDLLDKIDQALRLPKIWQRCADFVSTHLPAPAAGKDPAAAADTLTKLQNHPIGIDGCIAITKAEGTIDSYPFLAKSELYLEVMKKARTELPAGIEGKARGEWIRARQIEEIGRICGV